MPRRILNARFVETATTNGLAQQDFFDQLERGLCLRVFGSGRRSWLLFYKQHGRLHRYTLGTYPELGLADARTKATDVRKQVQDGGDPLRLRSDDRGTWGETVRELVVAYSKSPAAAARGWAEKSRILQKEVVAVWGDRRVRDVTRREVRELVEAKALTAPVLANRLLRHVRVLLDYAVDREWIEANPTTRLAPPAEEHHRERVLTRDELRALWATLTTPDPAAYVAAKVVVPDDAHRDAFLALILLGQRLTETCAMRWADVDLEAAWWRIPATVAKNKQAHRVPLPAPALELLQRRHDAVDRDATFVFGGRVRDTSIAARAKKTAAVLSRALEFEFHAHDLRRTVATFLAEAGVPRFNIACVMNHRSVTQHGVTATYDQYAYDKEKAAALEKWTATLQQVLAQQPGKVIRMPVKPPPAASADAHAITRRR